MREPSMNRASYLRELERLRRHLDALLEQALVAAELGAAEEGAPGSWSPAVDLFETADGYVLLAEVPGFERDEMDLEVEGRRLVLSGRRTPPEPGGAFQRMERHHGPFRRTFDLDHELDSGGIEAKLDAGVLAIRVPKAGPKARRIEVKCPEDADG